METITGYDGRPADPRRCVYGFYFQRYDNGALYQVNQCLAHGHGRVVLVMAAPIPESAQGD